MERAGGDGLHVSGWTTDDVGHVAHREGIELLELSKQAGALERLFLQLTGEAAVPPAAGPPPTPPTAPDGGPGDGQVPA